MTGKDSLKFWKELISQYRKLDTTYSLIRVLLSSISEGAVCLNRASTVLMGLRDGDVALLPTKKWDRQWKLELIEKNNQHWLDLYDTIFY